MSDRIGIEKIVLLRNWGNRGFEVYWVNAPFPPNPQYPKSPLA